MGIKDTLEKSWKNPNVLTGLLKPLSHIYKGVFLLRKKAYSQGVFDSYRAPIPVIVVGNLTVGGTGKTPLVIYLVEQLRLQGLQPGVISRGYSGNAPEYPFAVTPSSDVNHTGDEPALIVKRTGAPMMVGPDRKASIQALLTDHAVDVIISDDGLQHLALQRDIEICIVDDTSPQKNEHLLPAGPYREPLKRLMSVDFIIRHGGDVGNADNQFSMSLQADEPLPLLPQAEIIFPNEMPIHAVAGIGNPQRFFDTCDLLNYNFEAHSFADHHHFTQDDLDFGDDTVLMTEKDAVKCMEFADSRHWYLPVNAKVSKGLIDAIMAKLNSNFRLQRVSEIDTTNSDEASHKNG
jgi:tetraacyldisaccharide 4'-kinase